MFRILKNFLGSNDGMHVISYIVGQEVELSKSLGRVALRENWAEEILLGVAKPNSSKPQEESEVEVKTQRAGIKKRTKTK